MSDDPPKNNTAETDNTYDKSTRPECESEHAISLVLWEGAVGIEIFYLVQDEGLFVCLCIMRWQVW